MNIKNYLIKLLGGITKEEYLEFRKECEQFAKDFLTGNQGVTLCESGTLDFIESNQCFIVIGSNIRINRSEIGGIAFAPWVHDVVVVNSSGFTDKSGFIKKSRGVVEYRESLPIHQVLGYNCRVTTLGLSVNDIRIKENEL